MFGLKKKSKEQALEHKLDPLTEYPFFAENPDLPPPTAEDMEWGDLFMTLIVEAELGMATDLLHDALIRKDRSQVAIGLHYQEACLDWGYDLLKSGDHNTLYDEVWETDPVITEMYINTYHPNKINCHWRRLKPVFDHISPSTCQKWAEAGCGEFVNPLFYSLLQNGTIDQIKTFHANQTETLNINWEHNVFLKTALQRQETEVITFILEQNPNLTTYTLDILQLAVQHSNTDILKQLIEREIDIFVHEGRIFEIAMEQGQREHLTILESAVRESIARHGLKQPCKTRDGGLALSAAFIEYTRPKSPDGSQSKCQIDFESGYVIQQYLTNEGYVPFSYQAISEAYAENAQLIDKAAEALTVLGCPPPDLNRFFNNSGAKSIREVKKSPEAPLGPVAPCSKPSHFSRSS